MLGHKTSYDNFKKTEIISSIFSAHNTVQPEMSHKKKTEKYIKTWKLNNMLLNNQWVNNEIKEEIKRYLELSRRLRRDRWEQSPLPLNTSETPS